ncbi:MAG: hypothetical protein KIT69_13790 [Propionibacteriaceae bacterium]|nr:hypothetical protein [Propionibacteriaceae bacterium]
MVFPRDAGMSLIELVVYIGISALFLTILSSTFISSWQADAATRDRDVATGAAHTITNSIQTSIRNSRWFGVTGSTLLRARVATGEGTSECRTWELKDGRLLHTAGGSTTDLANIGGGEAGSTVAGSFAKNGHQLSVSLQVQFGEAVVPVAADAVQPAYQTEEAGGCDA